MAGKREIMDQVRSEFDRWEGLLTDLGEQQITKRELPADLSVKDTVAHLMAWQQRSVARLEAGLGNRAPQFPAWPPGLDPESDEDLDQINAWIHEQYQDESWPVVFQAWRNVFLRLLELGEAIPESDLMAPGRYPWMDGEPLALVLTASYEHHHAEHWIPLVAWLHEHDIRSQGAG